MPGRLVCALCVISLLSAGTPAHAQLPDSVDARAPAAEPPAAPTRFLHDSYFLGYVARFSSAVLRTDGDLPGRLGLESDRLAERLPGLGFRRNGTPYQVGELYAWGGDGRLLGYRADRCAWEGESLNHPPSGAADPILLPGPHDTAYLLPAPLLGFAPMELILWRDPGLPDSAQAIARHSNGPFGFSYTGGRFRADVGRGWEFDGQVYRVFADGTVANTDYDAHNLDIEMRRRIWDRPLRIRFRQNRGERLQSFRWISGGSSIKQIFLLSHLDLELAWPKGAGEWLLAGRLRHEDQKLRPLAPADASLVQKWFSRTLALSLSYVHVAAVSGWAEVTGNFRHGENGQELADRTRVTLRSGLETTLGRLDLTIAGGASVAERSVPLYHAGAALAYRWAPATRLVWHAGIARQAPSDLLRYYPAAIGPPLTYQVAGAPQLEPEQHRSMSITIRHESHPLDLFASGAVGRADDLAAWQPAGDTATDGASYVPLVLGRRWAGTAAHVALRPFSALELWGSGQHLFANEWLAGGEPAFAPQESWAGGVRAFVWIERVGLSVVPQVSARGAYGGTLPEEYATLSAGVDLALKQLTVFIHRENLLDREYRTGGAEFAYGRHTRYGFRWEFWN